MFTKTAKYYDEIYASMEKDYQNEAGTIIKFIRKYKKTKGRKLLDVACGTGHHAGILNKNFNVEGIDLDARMIAIAKKKHPHMRFRVADMIDFNLHEKFDVITCLFSSIGYVQTKPLLKRAVTNMANQLLPGGVLLIEPWTSKRKLRLGMGGMLTVSRDDLRIARMSRMRMRGNISILEFQYLISTPKKIEHFVEYHRLGLFTKRDYLEALRSTELKIIFDPEGIDGRGLYIGLKA